MRRWIAGLALFLTLTVSTAAEASIIRIDASRAYFEGGPNDVPITALSRNIEIDLRELLDELTIPAALQAENNILL